jgi:hypothetical protein
MGNHTRGGLLYYEVEGYFELSMLNLAAMHVTNTSNFTMADMSSEAVVLASESDEDSPR